MAELIDFFFQNIYIYILILIVGVFIYLPLFKKFSVSIIDPAFMAIAGALFANCIPIFLLYGGYCDYIHFIYFLISEILFWLFAWHGYKKNCTFSKRNGEKDFLYFSVLYRFFLIIFVVTHLLTYIYVGIPLLMKSRLEAYTGSGGMGALSYFMDFSIYYILFYSFYKLYYNKNKRYIINILLVLIVDLLSGSKGAVLNILFTYFVFSFFYCKNKPKINKKYYPLLIAFPLIVITINLYTSEDEHGSLFVLIYRIISYGDVYWEAYPDNLIDTIHYKSPIISFFSPFLGPLRIVDYKHIEPAIGFLIHWELIPSKEGELSGPNARIPVFSWIYLRWFGLIFSVLFGYVLGNMISKMKLRFHNTPLGICLYGYIYITAWSICTDPSLFMGKLLVLIINLLLVYFIIIFIKLNSDRNHY